MENISAIPNLRHLRVLESVGWLHSVSRAASLVNLSQPAVSQAVASLESRFGVKLLERHSSGSRPTEYGEILLFRINRMQLLMRQGIQEFLGATSHGHKVDVDSTLAKITLTQIRGLIAVSENISFDQAARSIGVSQPSLHRAARDLEKLLRGALYVRGARGTTTTKDGTLLARRLKLAVREIGYASDEINSQEGTANSTLLIGTLSASGALLLARAVDRMLRIQPSLTIKVIEEPYEHLLNDLLLGNIDFLFSVLRRPAWATEVAEEMFYRDDYVVAARPEHPLSKRPKMDRNDLAEFDWVIPGPSTPRFRAFQSLFGRQRVPSAHVTTTSRALTRALVVTSNRLTLLTRHEAESEQSLGVMVILPFDCNIPAPAYGVATRSGWAPTSTQRQFLDILRGLATNVDTTKERVIG